MDNEPNELKREPFEEDREDDYEGVRLPGQTREENEALHRSLVKGLRREKSNTVGKRAD